MSFISDAIRGFTGFVAQNMPPLPWEQSQITQPKSVELTEANGSSVQDIVPTGDELPAVLPSQDGALYEKVNDLSRQLQRIEGEKTMSLKTPIRKGSKKEKKTFQEKIQNKVKELEKEGQCTRKELQQILFKELNKK